MSSIQYHFPGKGVVVTGGAQGIGFEIARLFLKAGARVAIWDLSEKALEVARAALDSEAPSEGRLHFSSVDVGKRDSCLKAAQSLPFGLDILVNNAGITRDKSFVKMTEEEWSSVIQTNLTGLFHVTKSLFDKFDASSSQKRIINLASVVAFYGNFGQTNYVASKAGVIGMTKTWAREFARKGFTVNAIAPGFIETSMTAAMPKEAIDSMLAKIPLGRMGRVSDIASACLFLASEESSYINGAVLSVDGALVG